MFLDIVVVSEVDAGSSQVCGVWSQRLADLGRIVADSSTHG